MEQSLAHAVWCMVEDTIIRGQPTLNMKLDNEQVICLSTIGYKSDSKPYSFVADTKRFENKERPLGSIMSVEGIVQENQNGVVHDIKGDDWDSDFSPYPENARGELTASELGCSNSVRDFANGNEVGDFVTLNSRSSKNMNSFQDSVCYSDKSVTECELPELVVCYRESAYHIVKDICIDEGVPTQDKFLFNSGADEKSDCDSLHSEKDQDKLDADTCMQDVSLSPDKNEANKEISNQCDSKDSMVTREMKDDALNIITDDISEEFALGEMLSLPELSMVKSEVTSSNCESDKIEQQSFQNSCNKEVILSSAVEDSKHPSDEPLLAPALVSADEESDSGIEEATLISPARASTSEEATSSSLINVVSDDSKLETESITLETGSSLPATVKDDREPLVTGRTSKLKETPATQPFSSNFRHGNGEASFSAAGPVTGLITYSGPIAYTGNLSLRSDSSTTSTRSFAFPILNTEWNSSPVRMAKADRRQYRKHRGWREGLLCCRF